MPSAVCLIRDRPPYPHPQFAQCLTACGYKTVHNIERPGSDDVLMIWNRSGHRDHEARRFEAAGAVVVVVENGWIGKAPDGGKLYAMCLNHHNGAGRWAVGDGSRWPSMGVVIEPWRKSGGHILVIASRGIGEQGLAQPREWPEQVADRLAKRTKRRVVIRRHPGDSHADLSGDLTDCHAVVTWSSGGAIKALAKGIPVFYAMPKWIGASAAVHGIDDIEQPFLGDRLPMFERLSWAQWSASEIASGDPLRWLLTSRSTSLRSIGALA